MPGDIISYKKRGHGKVENVRSDGTVEEMYLFQNRIQNNVKIEAKIHEFH
jgi:hypothetical protein